MILERLIKSPRMIWNPKIVMPSDKKLRRNKMTRNECEQLQDDIITYMNGQPEILIDKMCQIVVDYFNQQIEKDKN